jgi:hypothetical protein
MMYSMKTTLVSVLVVLALGFGYLKWLDHGCPLNGVMTWGGKECV